MPRPDANGVIEAYQPPIRLPVDAINWLDEALNSESEMNWYKKSKENVRDLYDIKTIERGKRGKGLQPLQEETEC